MKVQARKHTEQIVKLSVLDYLGWSQGTFGFFYQYQIDANILRSGLEQTLNDFPIFAGTLEEIDSGLGIHCNNHGVDFSVAEHDCPILEVLPEIFDDKVQRNLFDIVEPENSIGSQAPLLKIKVNYFNDGGMCLAISWHHAVGDALTISYLLKAFSNIVAGVAGKNFGEKPIIVSDRDRYLIEHLEADYNISANIRYLTNAEIEQLETLDRSLDEPYIKQQFYFSPEELQTMKQALIEKTGYILSPNAVLSAHMWAIMAECEPEIKKRYLSITTDFRSLTMLPKKILGNMITHIEVSCLTQPTPENIAQETINALNLFATENPNNLEHYRFLTQQKDGNIFRFMWNCPYLTQTDPTCRRLGISNISKLGYYDIDFGQGNPFYVTSPLGDSDYAWCVLVCPGYNNRGLIFSTMLPSVVMKKLTSEKMLAKIHKYRNSSENLPELVTKLAL